MEDPSAYRGHALEATIDGTHWYAWETADGSWSVRQNGGEPVEKADWTAVRHTAERKGNPRAQNPVDPVVASAAAAGMAFAMRNHLINNPGDADADGYRAACEAAVTDALTAAGALANLTRPAKCDRAGRVWLMVRRGSGRATRHAVQRARLRVPVRIMEAPR